jgi:hypothetical protein
MPRWSPRARGGCRSRATAERGKALGRLRLAYLPARWITAAIIGTLAAGLARGALAHGGGLDGLGCHHDRKLGGYHCHRGPLAGRSFSSPAEAMQALSGSGPASPGRAPGAPAPLRAADPAAAVRSGEAVLQARGYDTGPVDGQLDPRSKTALRLFEEESGLRPTGRLDAPTLRALGVQP